MGQLSYVHGASRTPLIGRTVGAYFDEAATRYGERLALVVRHQEIRWSWRQLGERVEAFAAGLLARGLEPGERIGIWSPNNAEWVVTQFATAKAGLILVNINPAYRLSELEYALNQAGCTALITAARFKTSDYLGMLGELAPELATSTPGQLHAARLPALRLVIALGEECRPGTLRFDDVCALGGNAEREKLAALAVELQFDDPINIQFTSGTTGFPKGATLTHHNILNNGFFIGEAMRLGPDDRLCIPVPLYHCFGMVLGNLACLTHGAAMVYPGEGFDPLATLQTVAAERCTALHGVPTMFIAEMDHPDFAKFDLVVIAHRDHGRQPLPDRGDEACGRAHAPRRDHDRLRHDRDQPGQLSILDRRPGRAPRLDGRPGAAAHRGQDRRCRGTDRAARHARRIVDPRLFGHARLLERRGENARGDRPGAVDAYRRSGDDR